MASIIILKECWDDLLRIRTRAVEKCTDRNVIFTIDSNFTSVAVDISAMMDEGSVTEVENSPAQSIF